MSLIDSLRRALQAASTAYDREKPVLTTTQLAVMQALARGEKTQTELVELSGVDRSTMTEVMRRLSHEGHVLRLPSPEDGRARVCSLSASGRKLLAADLKRMTEAERLILLRLPSGQRGPLISSLDKIAKEPGHA